MSMPLSLAPRRRLTVADLRRHRATLLEIGSRHGVRNVRVFGSVARREADDQSDLDLLVDADEGRGLLDLAGFALDVEDPFHVLTQVATVPGLEDRISARVLAEAVPLDSMPAV